jgi:hypothetical protein
MRNLQPRTKQQTERERERPNGEVEEFLISNCKRSLLVCPIENKLKPRRFGGQPEEEEPQEDAEPIGELVRLSGKEEGEGAGRYGVERERERGGGAEEADMLGAALRGLILNKWEKYRKVPELIINLK